MTDKAIRDMADKLGRIRLEGELPTQAEVHLNLVQAAKAFSER